MNTIAIVIAFAGPVCFALAAPFAARRLPPRQATWMLTVGAVTSALSTTVVLALLAVVLVGQLPFGGQQRVRSQLVGGDSIAHKGRDRDVSRSGWRLVARGAGHVCRVTGPSNQLVYAIGL